MLKKYYESFGCNTELLKQANRKVTLHKLVKYITNESEKYPIRKHNECWGYACSSYSEREDLRIERKQNMARDWLEYLKWCKALKYDTDNMFIYMPNNFKKVHDRTAEEYQAKLDDIKAEEQRKRELEAKKQMELTKQFMKELFKSNENASVFEIKGKGMIIKVPTSAEELKAEGSYLHHCVGTYVDRVANGETNIFFVRKANEPDIPYFTLEFKNNKVIQCRGYKNCSMPADVRAFVKVFEKKMQEASNKEARAS